MPKDRFQVIVADGVSPKGVEVLSGFESVSVTESPPIPEDELISRIKGVDALVVRSGTKVTRQVIEAADCLQVIGRAGVGVDNVDVKAATEKGIVVMNTPGGNTISTAEHAFSLLVSLSRNIPQAHSSMKASKWDRKKFQGVEINNKVLGIIGMGRIGTEVARRAMAFGMRVVTYDPYLSLGRAKSLQVELFEEVKEMLPLCDFITLHIPMTNETKNLIDKEALELCKSGVRIVNCARGGLVNEEDLYEAIQSGKVAGAALDVYENEPPGDDFKLRELNQIVMTPHLGASTAEAQESVGIEIAESVADLLINGTICNAVNMPNVDAKTLKLFRPYLELGEKLGKALAQFAPNRCESLTVNYSGKIKEYDTTAITRSVLKGYLSHAIGPDANDVNALFFAENLGLKLTETKQSELGDFSELMSVRVQPCEGQECEISGTFFGNSARIVRINRQNLEALPQGVLLIMENTDKPGIVGWVGTVLGKNNVNIASMSLNRSSQESGAALSILNLDSVPDESVVAELTQDKSITSVKLIEL